MEIKLINACTSVLNNINITLPEKQIIAILSEDESNKNELINLITLEENIIEGQIKYGNKKIDKNSNNEKKINIRNNFYHMRENYENFLFNICIKEDFSFYLGEYDHKKLEELLKNFDLDIKILEQNHLDLTSSQIIKILLIIGLMSKKKVLILENPTSKLDIKSRQNLLKCLKKIKRDGKTIIIVTNDENFLLELTDVILVLQNNCVVECGNKFEILSNEKLLKHLNFRMPDILNFQKIVRDKKNIKLNTRDNINDLIKDIYRYAK